MFHIFHILQLVKQMKKLILLNFIFSLLLFFTPINSAPKISFQKFKAKASLCFIHRNCTSSDYYLNLTYDQFIYLRESYDQQVLLTQNRTQKNEGEISDLDAKFKGSGQNQKLKTKFKSVHQNSQTFVSASSLKNQINTQNCFFRLKSTSQKTDLISILLNGTELIQVTKLDLNATLSSSSLYSSNNYLVIATISMTQMILTRFKINTSTCQISDQNIVTYRKNGSFLQHKVYKNQLYFVIRISIDDPYTYREENGISQVLNVTQVFVINFSEEFYEVWKLDLQKSQNQFRGAIFCSNRFSLVNQQVEKIPTVVFSLHSYFHSFQEIYEIPRYNNIIVRANFLIDRVSLIVTSFLTLRDNGIIVGTVCKGGSSIAIFYPNKKFGVQEPFIESFQVAYLSQKTLQFQHLTQFQNYNEEVQNVISRGKFHFVYFGNTFTGSQSKVVIFGPNGYLKEVDRNAQFPTAYAINEFDQNFYIAISNYNLTRMISLQVYEVQQNFDFILKSEYIPANGSIADFSNIFLHKQTRSIIFTAINEQENIPTIFEKGMYYLYLTTSGCITAVPSTYCSLSSYLNPRPFVEVYKHWDSQKGDFWTAPAEYPTQIKILRKNNKNYIYSFSQNQIQARLLEEAMEYRKLKNPVDAKSMIKL